MNNTLNSNDKNKSSGLIAKTLDWVKLHCLPQSKRIRSLQNNNIWLNTIQKTMPQAFVHWPEGRSDQFTISQNLLEWLDIDETNTIKKPIDLVDLFQAEDRAQLRRALNDFNDDRIPFDLNVSTIDDRHFNIQTALMQTDTGTVYSLWFHNISRQKNHLNTVQKQKENAELKLRETLAAMKNLPFPVWIRDENGALKWVNSSYAVAVESTFDDVIEQQIELLGTKANIGRNMTTRAFNGRTPITERHHVIIDGDRYLYEITESKLPDLDQILGYGRDVTPLEDMESEMRRFKASTSELLRSLNTGIAIFNPNQEVTFYNDSYCDLFHLEEQWLDQKPTLAEIMENCREKRRLPEQADFRTYKNSWLDMFTSLIGPHEDMMHLPDGTAIRMLVVPHPMGGLFMTFEDVTSRLELESSYNTLIAVQRETLDNLAEGLAVFGSDGRLQLYNPTYADIWNLKKRDLNRTPHIATLVDQKKSLFHDKDWEDVRAELLKSGIARDDQKGRIRLKDDRVLEYVTVPLPDGGMLNRYSDVTDTMRVERALRDKNAALEEADRLKLDFLANVSYQLRTPLNAMMGFAEVLEKEYFGPLNERQMEYASGMLDAGGKLISLVNDILDLSTIEAGYLELNIQPVNIHSMVETIQELTEEWARKQDINLVLDCPASIGTMHADERRLKQVLLNLISNAIKFTPEKGTITLSVSKKDGKIHFSVTDTGEGIPADDQKRIFGPFVQTKQRNEGAGLGLSLVKSIIELHGGDIELHSAEGDGTTVTCILPQKAKTQKT